LFPFVTLPLIAFLVYLGLQDLRSPKAKGFPIRKGLAIFCLMVLTATAGFGALSLWLATAGWAQYDSTASTDLYTYSGYYLWLFLDMVPVLEVTDTLGLVAPLEPVGLGAGLPVLAFRIVVLFGLLKALRAWWERRKGKAQ
jgi:hypothetical protein